MDNKYGVGQGSGPELAQRTMTKVRIRTRRRRRRNEIVKKWLSKHRETIKLVDEDKKKMMMIMVKRNRHGFLSN